MIDEAEPLLRHLGPVVAGALTDPDVTEVYVNPHDHQVRLETRSAGRTSYPCTLESEQVEMFLNAAAAREGVLLKSESPFLETTLPEEFFRRARLQGFVPPVTREPAFTIRKPPAIVYGLDDYVARDALSPTYRKRLRDAIRRRQSILVCGGTNSGKTTFANALLHEMNVACPTERIVILEDTTELQCVARDHLALRTPVGGTLAQLVKATLRASPDRIIVGEVRDEAALDLLDAWATGHPGGVATLHATSPGGALARLDRLAQRANVPSQAALIGEAVDWIVMMGAGRRVRELVRVIGLDETGRFLLDLIEEGDDQCELAFP
ncbi:MAG TPA: ATPase, T2SS/T4P/T4SS family [Gemmatimonadaceae bacterium]|nr:ATPase, T2SS/T4P/T4SS family [Gemmatimonadaceae bacterium]